MRKKNAGIIEALAQADLCLRNLASDLRNPALIRLAAREEADNTMAILSLHELDRAEKALRSIASDRNIRSDVRLKALREANNALKTLLAAGLRGQSTDYPSRPVRKTLRYRWINKPFAVPGGSAAD